MVWQLETKYKADPNRSKSCLDLIEHKLQNISFKPRKVGSFSNYIWAWVLVEKVSLQRYFLWLLLDDLSPPVAGLPKGHQSKTLTKIFHVFALLSTYMLGLLRSVTIWLVSYPDLLPSSQNLVWVLRQSVRNTLREYNWDNKYCKPAMSCQNLVLTWSKHRKTKPIKSGDRTVAYNQPIRNHFNQHDSEQAFCR